MPIIMLWMRIGDAFKIFVIALGISLPLVYHSQQGSASVNERMIWVARGVSMSEWRIMFKIILPAASPSILAGFKVSMVISAIVVLSAVMISSTNGLGYLLMRGARSFRTIEMFTSVASIALITSVLGFILTQATRPWLGRFR